MRKPLPRRFPFTTTSDGLEPLDQQFHLSADHTRAIHLLVHPVGRWPEKQGESLKRPPEPLQPRPNADNHQNYFPADGATGPIAQYSASFCPEDRGRSMEKTPAVAAGYQASIFATIFSVAPHWWNRSVPTDTRAPAQWTHCSPLLTLAQSPSVTMWQGSQRARLGLFR
jgi:hypothetical protein